MDAEQEMRIADGLVIKWADIASLKEQDLNAQIMEPRKFDALTSNIKLRGMLESLPYCYQPDGEGQIQIVSGHHRVRAAARAGIKRIPVIVDEKPMSQSTVVAKQIAANELTGSADEKLLAQLVLKINDVDDMLLSGLDSSHLPQVEPEKIDINGLNAEYQYKTVELMFLPAEFEKVKEFVKKSKADLVGLADDAEYQRFCDAVVRFANRHNIKNMGAAVIRLIDMAREDEKNCEENVNK